MSLAVQEDVLRLAVPVHDALLVQVAEPEQDLAGVEPAAVLGEARLPAHVVDVELEVAAGHDGEDEAQAVFGLERVRKVHHEPANAKK